MSLTVEVDNNLLQRLVEESKLSSRKRAFGLIRSADSSKNIPSIMVNALQPGTYVRPHRHPKKDGKELLIYLQGELKVLTFDQDGKILENFEFSSIGSRLIEIPSRTYHSVLALSENSVILDMYLGLFNPDSYKEFASWAPEEDLVNYGHLGYLDCLIQQLI